MHIRYDADVAHALGCPLAAVYLECLRLVEREPGSVVLLATREIADLTGMRPEQIRAARTRLVQRRIVELKEPDGQREAHVIDHKLLGSEIKTAALVRAKARVKAADAGAPLLGEPPKQLALDTLPLSITPADILRGAYDHLVGEAAFDCEPLIEALVAHWARAWGRDPAIARVTKDRRSALRRALVEEKRKPSQIARATLGMLEDDWDARGNYCELRHVVANLERWLVLLDDVATGRRPRRGKHRGTKLKSMKGHAVPADYDWTTADDHAAASGLTFDLETRRWMRPAHA